MACFIDAFLSRLYTQLAWAYDLVSWLASAGNWHRWQRVALQYVQGERVLEVGCGTGRMLEALANGKRRVYGGDLSPNMLRLAGRRARRAGLVISLCRAQAQALPFAAGSFDMVVCTFPAGYIADAATWAEFERVLAPGRLVVVVYGVHMGKTTLARRLAALLLALGRTDARELRPRLGECGLRMRRVSVQEGVDRVQVLVAERLKQN